MLRPAMLALSVVLLGATAAAATAADPALPKYTPANKFPKVPKTPALDPVWQNQRQTQGVQPVHVYSPATDYAADLAAIRRQTLEEKAAMMNTVPGALTAPVRLSVRTPYVDEYTWMMVASGNGVLEVLPTLDQVQMRVVVSEPILARPSITLNFRADPARRYHVECAVAGTAIDGPQNISATDGTTTYSVNTTARATLVFIVEPRPASLAGVQISLYGEKRWTFRGCDITSAPA